MLSRRSNLSKWRSKEINEKASKKIWELYWRIDRINPKKRRPNRHYSSLKIISELKDTEANGRIIIDLMDDSMPTLVRSNDSIFIPEKNNNVFIFGEIASEDLLYIKRALI